jgi:hypothetical protein
MAGDFNMGNQSQVLRPTRENEQEKLDPANELGRNFSAPENEHLLERILTIMSNSYSFNMLPSRPNEDGSILRRVIIIVIPPIKVMIPTKENE